MTFARSTLFRLAGGVLLAAGVGACASDTALTTFTLTAPEQRVSAPGRVPGLLIVATPTAIQVLSTDRILVKEPTGAVSTLPGAQWADQLPALVQSRLIQTFENASRLTAVSRPGDRVRPDVQLNTEIRSFQIETATGEAVVQIAAKAVSEDTGRITAARIFTARTPVAAVNPAAAAQALDASLSQVLLEVVRWAGTSSGAPRAPRIAEATAQP